MPILKRYAKKITMMTDCIFCSIASGKIDSDLTVYEDEHVFVQISLHQKPANRGHVLVIPKNHVTNIFKSPSGLDAPLMAAIRRTSVAVKNAFWQMESKCAKAMIPPQDKMCSTCTSM